MGVMQCLQCVLKPFMSLQTKLMFYPSDNNQLYKKPTTLKVQESHFLANINHRKIMNMYRMLKRKNIRAISPPKSNKNRGRSSWFMLLNMVDMYIKSGTSGSGGHNLSYLGRLQLSLLIKPNQNE